MRRHTLGFALLVGAISSAVLITACQNNGRGGSRVDHGAPKSPNAADDKAKMSIDADRGGHAPVGEGDQKHKSLAKQADGGPENEQPAAGVPYQTQLALQKAMNEWADQYRAEHPPKELSFTDTPAYTSVVDKTPVPNMIYTGGEDKIFGVPYWFIDFDFVNPLITNDDIQFVAGKQLAAAQIEANRKLIDNFQTVGLIRKTQEKRLYVSLGFKTPSEPVLMPLLPSADGKYFTFVASQEQARQGYVFSGTLECIDSNDICNVAKIRLRQNQSNGTGELIAVFRRITHLETSILFLTNGKQPSENPAMAMQFKDPSLRSIAILFANAVKVAKAKPGDKPIRSGRYRGADIETFAKVNGQAFLLLNLYFDKVDAEGKELHLDRIPLSAYMASKPTVGSTGAVNIPLTQTFDNYYDAAADTWRERPQSLLTSLFLSRIVRLRGDGSVEIEFLPPPGNPQTESVILRLQTARKAK